MAAYRSFFAACLAASIPATNAMAEAAAEAAPQNTPVTIGFANVPIGPFTAYEESGFTVRAKPGNGWRGNASYGDPAPDIEISTPARSKKTASIRVTHGGESFTFSSASLYSSIDSISYRFRGLLAGAEVFSTTGDTGQLYGNYASFSNTEPSLAIDTLEISIQDDAGCCNNPAGIDDIVVAPVDIASTYTLVTPTIPGALSDTAVAVNNAGVVIGQWYDAQFRSHGYVYRSGKVTVVDVPGAGSTALRGINDAGDIVGEYDRHGFIYRANGKFETVDNPGYLSTALEGINDSGLTCGDSYQAFSVAFTYRNGVFTPFTDEEGQSYATAINNRGWVVGDDDLDSSPFLYADGVLTHIPTNGGTGNAAGISNHGVVVGSLKNPVDGEVGYWYRNGKLKTLAVPGASGTFLNAINDLDVAAGGYYDAEFNQTAFVTRGTKLIRLPVIGNNYMTPTGINKSGVVVGNYLDSNNGSRTFIATPVR